MGYISMGGKKLAVAVAVVVAIIAAAKGSMAQTPAPPDCVNELLGCLYFNDPSSPCCKAIDRAYHKYHSCLCTYLITDDFTRNIYLGYYASCKINVPQNICMPGENPVNSAASLLKDKTAIQKTSLIAVSTFLGFLFF